MALNSFYNLVAAGLVGGLIAHIVPGAIEDFKKGFNEAQARQRNKPWSESTLRTDGPGTSTLYALPGAMSILVYRNAAGKIDRDRLPAVTLFRGDGRTVIRQG